MTRKMKCLVIYIPLVTMMLALSACGVPQDQYNQLRSELTSSQQQLEGLNTRIEDLTKTNGELNTQVEDLTKTNGELEASLNSATKLNEEIKAQVEDLTKTSGELKNSLNSATKLNEELSAIAAYSLWYDHYYGTGAYDFNDTTAFNSQLGSLIAAIDDTDSRSAFDAYYTTDYDYSTLVYSLPEDNIWTQSQYESWVAAGEFRKEALGQVGVQLLNELETISWFGEK